MEDAQIIELYFQRDEAAITETVSKYGAFCERVAMNILSVAEDAEECVNDTYLQAWKAIPPQRPNRLGAWLGRVVRNTAINLWHKNHRNKRYAGLEQLFNELEECLPSPETIERELDAAELTKLLNTWLASLSKADRVLFMRRYWNGEALKQLAREQGIAPQKIANRMYRLRQSLKSILEQEGFLR